MEQHYLGHTAIVIALSLLRFPRCIVCICFVSAVRSNYCHEDGMASLVLVVLDVERHCINSEQGCIKLSLKVNSWRLDSEMSEFVGVHYTFDQLRGIS